MDSPPRSLLLVQGAIILLCAAFLAVCAWAMTKAPWPALIVLSLTAAGGVFLIFCCAGCISAAPFVPTTAAVARRMVELAEVEEGARVYDLGSGNGSLLFLAAQAGARAIGYEMNPFLAALTMLRARFSPLRGRIAVRWASLWRADVSDADAVLVYLMPYRMKKLSRMLRAQLKPGAVVVSNSFRLADWAPEKMDAESGIYVYRA